jgi:adenosine deaminase
LDVTINCDNRLMSATTMSREFALVSEAFNYDLDDLEQFSLNAAHGAFLPAEERLPLVDRVRHGFAALRH